MNAVLCRSLLFLALSVLCSSNAFAQGASDQTMISVNYDQADIRQVIAAVAEITGNVYPRSNRSAFDALGFTVGDLIIGFDGLFLADAGLANIFLCSLEASTVGYVTLIRDGESKVIQMK